MTDEITNRQRAESVALYVAEFAKEHYWGGENLHTVVQDFITNLGHLLDHQDLLVFVDVLEVDPEQPDFDEVVAWATGNYDEEVAEERAVPT